MSTAEIRTESLKYRVSKHHTHPHKHLKLLKSPKVIEWLENPRFKKRMAQGYRIDRSYDIPYLAGYSWDAKTVFFDRDFHPIMPDGFDTTRTLSLHERTEKGLIDFHGLDYQQAHHIATGVECRAVDEAPGSPGWKVYSEFLGPQIKHIGHEKIQRVPATLDLTPYEDEHDRRDLQKLMKGNVVDEALTLRYHDQLNPDLWDGDQLKPEVREKMMKFASSWAVFAKIPRDKISDVILTGGNANFNYTPESDLDVHVVVDRSSLGFGTLTDDWLDNKKKLWTLTRNAKIHGYALEPYAQDMNQPYPSGQGVYSIKDNLWVERPVHGSYNFTNDPTLQRKADRYEKMIDDLIASGASEQKITNLKHRLVTMRRAGLIHGGEFSHENLLFKELRNRGILGRLSDYLLDLEDRNLSL